MLTWLRLLLLALLIPAYGWAAGPWMAVTTPDGLALPALQCAASQPDDSVQPQAEAGLIELLEAVDASGELPEHGLPAAGGQPAPAEAHRPSAPCWQQAPEAPPQRLLRPPMHQA